MRTLFALFLTVLIGLLLAPLQPTFAKEDPAGSNGAEKPDEEKKGDPDILEAPGDDEEDEGTGPVVPEGPTYRQRGPVRPLRDEGTPAGMVRVPAGVAVIGSTAKRLGELLKGRPDTIKERFAYERPRHHVPMASFFADEYEVSNAQYHAFLVDVASVTYRTVGQLANLEEVAGHLLRLPRSQWGAKHHEYWRQLYEANKEQLQEKMADVVVRNVAGKIDEEKTARAFRRAPLIRDLQLEFLSLKPPEYWTGIVPDEAIRDHPIRAITYNDAAKYAEWAGKHVLTEPEWAYVARGPEAFFFPWGDEWFPDASHANWGGKIVRRFVPTTVPVDSDLMPADLEEEVEWTYDGMSWCGAWHMLGNVAEWTSSWFEAYPDPDVERDHDWMGGYVKVIRGAGLKDSAPLVLRLAARNYRGGGMKAPPIPGSRFDNVGFRCAWYGNPGQDQLEPILRRIARGKHVKREGLAMDQWVGAATMRMVADAASAASHTYVTGRAHSIVLIPLKTMLPPEWKKPKIRKRNDLLKMSVDPDRTDPIPLAILHTDVPLTKVYVPDREEAARRAAAKPSGRRRRQKPKTPPMKEGTCPPGSYILAFWHQRLCIARPDLEPVCFLSKGPIDGAFLDIKKLKAAKIKPTALELTPVADLIQIGFTVPVGGKGTDDALRVVVDGVLLNTVKGMLGVAGTWMPGAYKPLPADVVAAAKAADKGEPVPKVVPEKPTEEAPKEAPKDVPEEAPDGAAPPDKAPAEAPK